MTGVKMKSFILHTQHQFLCIKETSQESAAPRRQWSSTVRTEMVLKFTLPLKLDRQGCFE